MANAFLDLTGSPSLMATGENSLAVGTSGGGNFTIITNDIARLLIDSAGAIVTGGALTVVGGTTVFTGNLTVSAGNLTFGAAASQIVPGATSLALRNNANSANNVLVSDAGVVTIRAGLTVTAGATNLSAGGLRTVQAVNNVHDTTPTAAELTTSFGSVGSLGRGFIGTVDDADGDTNGYIVWTSDASFYFLKGTKAL